MLRFFCVFSPCRVRGHEDHFLKESHPKVPQRPQHRCCAAPQFAQTLGGGSGPRRLEILTGKALQCGGRHSSVGLPRNKRAIKAQFAGTNTYSYLNNE